MGLTNTEFDELKKKAFKIGIEGAYLYPTSHRSISDSIVNECISFYYAALKIQNAAKEYKKEAHQAKIDAKKARKDASKARLEAESFNDKADLNAKLAEEEAIMAEKKAYKAEAHAKYCETRAKEEAHAIKLDAMNFFLDVITAVYKSVTNKIKSNSPIYCCVGLVKNCVGEIFVNNRIIETYKLTENASRMLPSVVINIHKY